MTSLVTGVEFSTTERSIRGTETLETAIRGLCEGIHTAQAAASRDSRAAASGRNTPERDSPPNKSAPPQTPPHRRNRHLDDEADSKPELEPEVSTEMYSAYIFGSVSVNNPVPPQEENKNNPQNASAIQPPVTVLAVRKKKKRPE
jgi:regulator of Ty1 transposition protein 109